MMASNGVAIAWCGKRCTSGTADQSLVTNGVWGCGGSLATFSLDQCIRVKLPARVFIPVVFADESEHFDPRPEPHVVRFVEQVHVHPPLLPRRVRVEPAIQGLFQFVRDQDQWPDTRRDIGPPLDLE